MNLNKNQKVAVIVGITVVFAIFFLRNIGTNNQPTNVIDDSSEEIIVQDETIINDVNLQ